MKRTIVVLALFLMWAPLASAQPQAPPSQRVAPPAADKRLEKVPLNAPRVELPTIQEVGFSGP